MIFLVVIMTIGGQDFERREPMPNIRACWERAVETWESLQKQHPEVTGMGVGCSIANGEPA